MYDLLVPSFITLLFNYNFISTCIDMGGNKRYFVCEMSKFAMEIKISMRQVEFPLDQTWNFNNMWHFHKM